ncbi:MAG TPA: Crp/Fnr family transcriptional regulator [Candidatus Angelobacter sp.]|nr:Crp/Fnr family transcriptional regulator [Candidatus Angelobacter sp.]
MNLLRKTQPEPEEEPANAAPKSDLLPHPRTAGNSEQTGDTLPMLWLLPEHLCHIRQARQGDSIYSDADAPDSVYYVEKGSVKLIRTSQAGDEVVIDRYYAGSIFGNLSFHAPSQGTDDGEYEAAVALEDSKIVITTFDSLKKNIHHRPEKLFALLEDYCRRLAVARRRIESLVVNQAEERLARTLLLMTSTAPGSHSDSVALIPPITYGELACWIGVTRPFVTKLMQQLQNRGFIERLEDGSILVHREKITSAYF